MDKLVDILKGKGYNDIDIYVKFFTDWCIFPFVKSYDENYNKAMKKQQDEAIRKAIEKAIFLPQKEE